MKRKILISMSFIALLSTFFSMVLSAGVSYYDSLKIIKYAAVTESEYIASGIRSGGNDYLTEIRTTEYGTSQFTVRVTLIADDGSVAFDSVADVDAMQNHSDRPEVQEARQFGTGESIRLSDTVNVQSYNYAVLLEDGRVLRLSVGMRTVFGSIERMLPWMVISAAIILLIAVILCTFRTKQIVTPINTLDLDHPLQNHIYEEISPLLQRIERQNQTIQEKMDELNRRQREFAAITENMQEGFVVVNSKGQVLSYNKSAERILGVQADTAEEQKTNLQTGNAELQNVVREALAGHAGEHVMQIGVRQYSLIVNPVQEAENVCGVVIVLLDVTEREERERMRREFSANVSHELKTPLTSISGYAEIISGGLVKPEDVPRFAGNIYTESQRLIALVEDIIQLSRLDERSDEMEPSKVDLFMVAQNIRNRLHNAAEKNNVTIAVQGESTIVEGIPQILDEMIYNLTDNAVKYNKPGGAVQIQTGFESGHPFFEVSDTGIGIPENDQERVFERFYRVDKSRSRQIGGTGLGLSIVKHGAVYHNASITLQSKENQGTVVRVIFN